MFIYAIPLLLCAAFLIPIISLKSQRPAPLIAILAIGISFLIVLMSAPPIMQGGIFRWSMSGWEPPIGIAIAVDGLGLLMALLVTGIGLAASVFSYRYIGGRKSEFYAALLLIVAGMYGVSITGDLFNLYVFFEIMSGASYILTVWSRSKESVEGGIKYMIISALSTSMILIGIAFLYGSVQTLNMADIAARLQPSISATVSLAFIVTGFLLKAAQFPFHFWLADAHPAAPSPMSALLSGVVVNMGLYSMLRLGSLTSSAYDFALIMLILGMVSMLVGSFMALQQKDIKRLLAYSTIVQMGYCFLALGLGTPLGLAAGLFHMLNHALMKSLLFFCVGALVYTVGIRNLNELGGLGKRMPVVAGCFLVGALAIAGIPPLSGFASKYMIYLATWEVSPLLTAFAIVISGITLAYNLKAFSSIFLGPEKLKVERTVPRSMMAVILSLTGLCLLIGFFPEIGLAIVQPAASSLLNLPNYISVVLGG